MKNLGAKKNLERAQAIAAMIDPCIPEDKKGETLSRKALWTVASTPGVTCVLNGMRSPTYVADALGVLAWEPLHEPHAVYRAVTAAIQSR